MIQELRKDIQSIASPEKAKTNAWFFKTGPGEYGEGDQFVGLTVPQQRMLAKKYATVSFEEITELLSSLIHEERLIALFILVARFQKADKAEKKQIYDFYMSHTEYINNWDLVDSSADKIVGAWSIINNDWSILKTLAQSKSLWERRIAMIGTYQYIKNGVYEPTLIIAEKLLLDNHDLIQKSVGWMLREMGKKCGQEVEESFLQRHYTKMGRTALRYAIEKFPEDLRKQYLHGAV